MTALAALLLCAVADVRTVRGQSMAGILEDGELREAQGGWHLLVQGELQRTSCGEPYLLGERAHRVLALYQRDYGGVIPGGAFLLLGNLPSGTLDSTRLGLVGRGEILGKVKVAPAGRGPLRRGEKSRCAEQGAIK